MDGKGVSNLGLGDLVSEMNWIALNVPKQIRRQSGESYERYIALRDELNKRERKYRDVSKEIPNYLGEFYEGMS